MNFKEYQSEAIKTDQVPGAGEKSLAVPLFGLAGEVGSLVTEYKKLLRDGPAYRVFKERISEEIGDILWYLSNAASKAGLDLQQVAEDNIRKVRSRWLRHDEEPLLPCCTESFYDDAFPPSERFPRTFGVLIEESGPGENPRSTVIIGGEQIGAALTDNAFSGDGYRFHDIFHFAFAAVLGWSPVTRALMKRKRKSNPRIDEVEDGGRAIVIEEALAALIFDYASKHSFLEDVQAVDYTLLRTIKSLTEHLEVGSQSLYSWEQAILQGAATWREICLRHGGRLSADLTKRVIRFEVL